MQLLRNRFFIFCKSLINDRYCIYRRINGVTSVRFEMQPYSNLCTYVSYVLWRDELNKYSEKKKKVRIKYYFVIKYY